MSTRTISTLPKRLDYARVAQVIEEFMVNVVRESGRDGVVVGLSGGVDSSTVATLAVRALGSKNVEALILPSRHTSREDVDDARSIAAGLNIRYRIIDVSRPIDAVLESYGHENVSSLVAKGNVAPRIRMTFLYLHANERNLLVAGTGNRSELLIGYFTKYGDGGVDMLPIGDLYKTQVRELARYLGIPQHIIRKVPTAGLWQGQTDEGEIGMTYEELDLVLSALIDQGMSTDDVVSRFGVPIDRVIRVLEMVRRSEHKRRMPPMPLVRDLMV